jgi:hypothetical protein
VGKEPEKEREDGAEEQTGDDGEVKGSVFAAMDDVARKSSKTKREFAAKVKESANEDKQSAQEEERSAEFAERVHDWILPETASE